MDEKKVVDYFVVTGLPDEPKPMENFSHESVKTTQKLDPIVDIAVITRNMGEGPPKGFRCLEFTPTGFPADMNHGSIRSPEVYLCYRRGRDKPPLTDIGVLYEGKERVLAGCEILHLTPHGRPANVNNSTSSRTYITYRRADETSSCDTLAVTDICIILANKGELPPHAYCQIPKNLNKGMVGSDVFLCYKKSMAKANTIAYNPALLSRYPMDNTSSSFALPESVPMFCQPLGATLESWSAIAQHPDPVFSTFVLTGESYVKIYGAAVTFYEEYDKEKLTETQKALLGLIPTTTSSSDADPDDLTVHCNKSICVLSKWPFFDTFRKFLYYIHGLVTSKQPQLIPIERHISHFITEVPFPSPQRPRILVQLYDETISLAQPEDIPLPLSGASFTTMLQNLGPENCMNVLLYGLMESKILIHSLRPAVLTAVAEAVANMIFPFHWQCPYIPLCPLGLSEVLSAPLPFIVGVDSRYFDMYDPPNDVLCIDLDTNTIMLLDEKKGTSTVNHKLLPKRPAKVLKASLERLFDSVCKESVSQATGHGKGAGSFDQDFTRHRKELLNDTMIQEAFLRFMACLLKGYNGYLSPITEAPTAHTTELSSLFDIHGFLKSRDKAYHKFFGVMMKTQMFSRFIEERSFVSDKDASLAFFDECVEKVDEYKDEPRLIDLDDTSKSERTAFVTPPEPTGLPEGAEYVYDEFPILNPEMYLHKVKPTLLTPAKQTVCPSSPMTRRTKQEIRTAQKMAQKHSETPLMWARCLMGHCYSLWFIHLPAYVKAAHSKTKALKVAYDVLVKMQKSKLQPSDEVCYRVLMQLCGLYHQPILAVKVLYEMKKNGVTPNAITYGFYNKAVLESKWPSSESKAYLRWIKIRNVIMGIAQFKRALRRHSMSFYSNSESDIDGISRTSVDSILDESAAERLHGEHLSRLHKANANNECGGGAGESTSTGGMSDKGYSSMTLEDARKMASAIASQDFSENKQHSILIRTKEEGPTATKQDKDVESNEKEVELKFPALDAGIKGAPRGPQRVDILLKRHLVSKAECGNARPSRASGSSAGLLMTSQTSFDDSIFGDVELSHSLHTSAHEEDSPRRRHKSLEDPAKMRPQCWQDTPADETAGEGTQQDDNKRSPLPAVEEVMGEQGQKAVDSKGDCTDTTEVSSVKGSNTSSPLKTLRTPVMDNDPLGLFTLPTLEITSGKSSSQTNVKNATPVTSLSTSKGIVITDSDRGLFGSERNLKSNGRSDLLLDLDPFCSEGNTESSTDVDGVTPSKSDASGTHAVSGSSFSSSEASSPGSPLKEWAPMSNNGTPKRARTLPPMSSHTAPAGTKTRKPVGRSESISNKLKFAASALSNKFFEMKQNMATPPREPGSGRGSSVSLPRSQDGDNSLLEDSTGSPNRGRHALPRNDERAESCSLQDFKDGVNRPQRELAYKFTPFVSDMFSGLMQSSLSALGWSNYSLSLDSLKSGGGEKDSPAQSQLERSIQLQDIDTGSKASLTSITQSFLSYAMEVEMCTLSKCNACQSLLYDEEIMAGWSADDSNLNTSCAFCTTKLVPFLQISIKDFRQSPRPNLLTPSQSMESMQSIQSLPNMPVQMLNNIPEVTPQKTDQDKPPVDCDVTPTTQQTSESNEESSPSASSNNDGKDSGILIDTSDTQDTTLINISSSSNAEDTPTPSADNNCNLIDLSPVSPDKTENTLSNNNDSPIGDVPDSLSSSRGDVRGSKDSGVAQDAQNGLVVNGKTRDLDTVSQKSLKSLGEDVSQASGSTHDIQNRKVVTMDPIKVAYLSPLVLRKELENVLDQEGDLCLTKPDFVDEHAILFWNLVWYFKRIDVSTHLPGFVLSAKSTQKDIPPHKSWVTADSRHVLVRPVWDNLRMHDIQLGQPMHVKWNNSDPTSATVNAPLNETQFLSKGVMQRIVESVMNNDVIEPIRLILGERRKYRNTKVRFNSIYRDILFLSFVALGRDNIDVDAFDKEYRTAFSALSPKEKMKCKNFDKAPKAVVIWCRRVFSELEL